MIIPFYKYQGTGNDFVILDNREHLYELTTEQVNFLCNRRFGIGCDGLMLLNHQQGYDFEMAYYNSDGKEGSMCGNGGRCLVQFAFDLGITRDEYNFIAVDGPHQASIDNQGWVRLKMKDVEGLVMVEDAAVLDTGSPHYVLAVEDVRTVDVVTEGRNIRNSPGFEAEGINVNFVQSTQHGLVVRTYERGVEDETLSCGTGVTASALFTGPSSNGLHRVHVNTLGGSLAVEYEKNENLFTNIWLCGPATFVFKGEIEI